MNQDIQISDTFAIRPRYSDVDKMGYVYHANHVTFCHQARTELMRKMGIEDSVLESKGIMMPVLDFNIKYKIPARYDEQVFITTIIKELPKTRFKFYFELKNQAGQLHSKAESTVCFVKMDSRQPMMVPDFVLEAITEYKVKS